MKSCACLRLQKIYEGLEYFNTLLTYLGRNPVSSYSDSDIMNIAKPLLHETGQLYPYAKILNDKFDVSGFDTNKNRLLPIPMRVLETYTSLEQNKGYY